MLFSIFTLFIIPISMFYTRWSIKWKMPWMNTVYLKQKVSNISQCVCKTCFVLSIDCLDDKSIFEVRSFSNTTLRNNPARKLSLWLTLYRYLISERSPVYACTILLLQAKEKCNGTSSLHCVKLSTKNSVIHEKLFSLVRR